MHGARELSQAIPKLDKLFQKPVGCNTSLVHFYWTVLWQ